MRIFAALILVVGLVLAGGAVFFFSEKFKEFQLALSQKDEPKSTAPAPTVDVLIAAKPLKYGDLLKKDSVKVIKWPKESAPEGVFATREELFGDGSIPRSVLRIMEKGEPVLKKKITGFGQRATISARLSPGKRAFTVRVNDVSGVAGFLQPGDRVDIVLTRKSNDGLVADIILQNIPIIGIDQVASEDVNKPKVARSVTVEVDPDQAQKLALATRVGKLSLSLRKIGSDDTATQTRVDVSDLLNVERSKKPAVQKVTVRKGGKAQVLNFKKPGEIDQPAPSAESGETDAQGEEKTQ